MKKEVLMLMILFIIGLVNAQNLDIIEVKELVIEGSELNIKYIFDNSKFIGDNVEIQIWIADEGNTIISYLDSFPINFDESIERNVSITLLKSMEGSYDIFFALSSDLDDYLDGSFSINKSGITGMAVFSIVEGKAFPYFAFLFVIFVVIFFIFMRYRRNQRRLSLRKKP